MFKQCSVFWMLAVATAAGCTPASVPRLNVEESLLTGVVKGNSEFAFDLYAELAGNPGNLFFSPYSISTALAMTYAGAQGETQTQMRRVLRFPLEGEQLHACFGALFQRLTQDKPRSAGFQLRIANRLWGEERPSFKFADAFLKITRDYYFSELAKVSFSKDSAGACKTINDWVSKQTQQKIRELLQDTDVDQDTILVLTNAIYFKGDWAKRFDEKATSEASFYLNASDNVRVPMMHQTDVFGYMAAEEFQALEMPYQGDTLSMIILLPGKRDGISEFEKSLSVTSLDQRLGTLQKREVEVFLPRFKLEMRFNLRGTLFAMGMPLAFDKGQAAFMGMIQYTGPPLGEDNISISDVIHKAYVDVNEKGTEAAAATAVTMTYSTSSVPERPPVFRADHPFVFLIRDNPSGSILFLGRLSSPTR